MLQWICYCCSVAKLCLTACNLGNCRTSGCPVLHYLPEFAQTPLHWVDVAIQPPHPLSPTSPALNLSQHLGLYQWVSFSHQVAKVWKLEASALASVLPGNIQDWFSLGLTSLISLLSKGLLRVFSSIAIWKHHFFSAQQGMWAYNIWVPVFIYFIYPGRVLLSHIVILYLAFWGITK